MRLMKALAALALGSLLAACGGGGGNSGTSPFGDGSSGGGGGGTTTGKPTITLTLQDSNGVALATPALTGTQNALAVVRLATAAGAPVANTLVTVSGAGLTLTPSTGQTLTDATGTAKVQIRASDPFASGATTVSASGNVSGSSLTASVDVALGAATAQLAAMSVSSSTVPAYQTVQVSVPATLGGTNQPAVQYPVSFSASCGTFDPPTATTDASGIARSAFRNQTSGNLACSGTQTLTAAAGSSTVTANVTAVAPAAANIVFVSALPARIYLAGSPGVSQSLLKFKLVDSNANAVQGANLVLTMTLRPTGAYLGSTAGTISLVQPTASDGTVEVAVNAGSEPGPVQVQAALESNLAIKNVSNTLAIASGLPVQRAFSLSVSTFNIEALTEDGVGTDITLRIADRLGNPVPDGTTVNFISEGGQVVASCNTTGAGANSTSACTVRLISQNPRPANNRITVLAWAQGEESFIDSGSPTNNIWDAGESFEDLGQPYLDKDENGVYDIGADATVGTKSGSLACPAGSQSVPDTCDGTWGKTLVRASTVITFSGSRPTFTDVFGPAADGPDRCFVQFRMTDEKGNPMPAGTSLAVSNVSGGGGAKFAGIGGEGTPVPNTADPLRTVHSAVFTECTAPATLKFQLTVSTPKGIVTTKFLP